MTAFQSVPPVQSGIIPGILFGYKIIDSAVSAVPQTASDNLLYFSVVYIDTWSEFHIFSPAALRVPSGPLRLICLFFYLIIY